MNLYQEMKIWKRLDDRSAVRYTCFRDLQNDQFAVQSSDFFYLPMDAQRSVQFEKQMVDLFIEESIGTRCNWFASLEAAIEAHVQDFT